MSGISSGSDDFNENIRNVKLAILRIGTQKLGPPPIEIQDKVQHIMELSELKAIANRLLAVQRWGDLFGP
jgi:hypothetical protein